MPTNMMGDYNNLALMGKDAPFEIEDESLQEEQSEAFQAPAKLLEFLQTSNIADRLDTTELARIGQKVLDEYEIDESSRSDWITNTEKAMKLAKQVAEEKSYPWPKAANVKYPIITSAAIQFSARAYPSIVAGNDVVKCGVTGADPDNAKASRAQRVSEHMSYQLLTEMAEWEDDQDRQLIVLSIVGTDFKKTYFDAELGRNRSIRIPAKNIVVNNDAKSLETASRITELFTLYPYEVTEKVNLGIYREDEYYLSETDDEYCPIDFIEQHCRLDLDDDDYPEPYIVTVHKDSGKVARIVACFQPDDVLLVDEGKTEKITLKQYDSAPQGQAYEYIGDSEESAAQFPQGAMAAKPREYRVAKIAPTQYYTKFGFIPDPDGGFYDLGLGILLNPLNESINTTLNQLLDAGHLANTGGGFIGRGLRMKRGDTRFRPGEYKPVDVTGDNVRNNIIPLTFPGPSPVLFQLLGMLIQAAREISSTSEIMAGDSQMAMAQPTTVMALIEQGQMVYSAVYKRIHRALSSEFKKLYRLNSIYLEKQTYFTVLDDQKAIARDDYAMGDMDVKPVSDPKMATDQQKLARANFLNQFTQDPFFNPMEIRRRMLEAAQIEDIETLLQPPQQGPDIGLMLEMAKLENEKAKISNETRKINAQVIESISSSVLNMEKAEAENAGMQLQYYQTLLQTMIMSLNNEHNRTGVPGMANPPGHAMGLSGPAGGQIPANGGMGGRPIGAGGPYGPNRGANPMPSLS